jgi:GYF domain 2
MSDLYWIKKDGDTSGPFTFPQVQSMWHSGTVKVSDQIRRDGKSEWHSISEVRRDLERGGGEMTVGKIVLAIVIAILVAAGIIFLSYKIPHDLAETRQAERALNQSIAHADAYISAYKSVYTTPTPGASPEESPTTLSSETAPLPQQPSPETQPVRSPATESPPPPPEYITLNRDVHVSHGTKKIVIPKGSTLLVVTRGSHTVGVRFEGEQEIIPESATSESK